MWEKNGGKKKRVLLLIPRVGDVEGKDVIKNIYKRTKTEKKFGDFSKFGFRLEVPLSNLDISL